MHVHVIAGDGDLSICREIRRRVFIEEQGVTEEEEWDGLDERCIHFLALDPHPLGTARMLRTKTGGAKAERVAVVVEARRRGVGAALMRTLEAEAVHLGLAEILLGAQTSALGFYEQLGYEAYGPEFDDARIPHRAMRKALRAPR